MEVIKKLNIPLSLTMSRLIIAPLILPVLLVWMLPLNLFLINFILALVFVFFALTDFFDGYLARKFNQETLWGRVLDPIADKFLVFSTLIALLAVSKISFIWVLILVGREIFIMGLRQTSLEQGFSVSVSWLGKVKTALQMGALTVTILNPETDIVLSQVNWNYIQVILLFLTSLFSIVSAGDYYQLFLSKMNNKYQEC